MRANASCLPVRGRYPRLEVLLVTSRSGGDWIAPKGTVEKGESAEEAALREAEEEAGVRGSIVRHLGRFGPSEVYLLRVTSELERWPEQNDRDRRWFPLPEAHGAVRRPMMMSMLRSLVA